MAITDELREYASGWWDRKCHDNLLAIAEFAARLRLAGDGE